MFKKTLEERVFETLKEDAQLPSSIRTDLSYFSDKLQHTKTEEEFDEVVNKYNLLKSKFKRYGLYPSEFEEILEDMKKEL